MMIKVIPMVVEAVVSNIKDTEDQLYNMAYEY